MNIRKSLILAVVLILGVQAVAQERDRNVISTAVPFLRIAPDARSGALGDCGVATSPDVYSMHWNPAKYAFMEQDFNIGLGYSPWLEALVGDMNIAYLALSKRLSPMSTFAASLRYFALGSIVFTDENNTQTSVVEPNEWSIDATYSRKLGDHISGAVAGRFIYSDLTEGVVDNSKPGISVAADVSLYYTNAVDWFTDMDAQFSWGLNISNIGAKMNYNPSSEKKDFIPTNLRLGPALKLDIDDYNTVTFMLEFNKLLVPTPPIYELDEYGNFIIDPTTQEYVISRGMNNDVSTVSGIFQSFHDSPYGFMEELSEVSIGGGAEYWYNEVFAVRAGYFHESTYKGGRKYVTLGAGLRYNVFNLDVSYLVPIYSHGDISTNPLQDTVRFNLTFDLDKNKKKDTPKEISASKE